MIDPRISVPRPRLLRIEQRQIEPFQHQDEQRPRDQVRDVFPHALAGPEPKPPVVIPRLRTLLFEEASGPVRVAIGAPERVSHVQRIRVDDEVRPGWDAEAVDDAVRRRGLGNGERGDRPQASGFADASGQERGGAQQVLLRRRFVNLCRSLLPSSCRLPSQCVLHVGMSG